MSSSNCFIFRQNDLMSTSFGVFSDMREKGELTDFKFSFGNRFLTGHRLVLSAAIPYFRAVFASSQEEITLKEIDPTALEAVIDFAYCGQIKITPENVRSLLLTSKYLKLDQLNEACWEFLERDLRLDNVLNFRMLAEINNCSESMRTADRFIQENFDEFSKSHTFAAVPFMYLKEIIRRDDLNVSCEENVFEAVIRWVKASPDERKDHLRELLEIVRMLNLPPEYLVERVSKEELIRTSIPCRDLVDEVKLYHWMPGKKSEISRFINRPRISEKSLASTQEGADKWGVYGICQSKKRLFVQLLDTENQKWRHLSTYEGEKVHTAVAFDRTIYIFSKTTVITFNLTKLTWKGLDACQHESVVTSGVVLHHKRIYFFGGELNSSSKVRCFDPQLNKWLKEGKMTRHLVDSGVTSLEQFIYLTGGDREGQVFATVEKYDPVTKKWNEVSPMLSERTSHGCTSLNGKIYVCGGLSSCSRGNVSFKPVKTTEVYDSVVNKWSFVSSIKESLWRISFVPNNGKIYVREKGQMFLDERSIMQIYDPEVDEWKLCAPEADPEFDGVCDVLLVSAPIPIEYDKTAQAL